ncbi:MAG: DUF1264 domain-containing protein [Gammaproteobacteria bacterium]|nr:DUF1264 domain-containing protein [Gammaproteobacteria bacterium]
MQNSIKWVIASLLVLTTGTACSGNKTVKQSDASSVQEVLAGIQAKSLRPYNSTFNPRQKEYPNHLGFNDLHIQAIRHLPIEGEKNIKPKLHNIVHHHCKAYDDGALICLMFHGGMKDNDKPIGFEYIINKAQYDSLPATEKKHWHYHKVEVPLAKATFPDLTKDEAAKLLPAVAETYGKVIYIQHPDDKLPIGQPYILDVHSMPNVD